MFSLPFQLCHASSISASSVSRRGAVATERLDWFHAIAEEPQALQESIGEVVIAAAQYGDRIAGTGSVALAIRCGVWECDYVRHRMTDCLRSSVLILSRLIGRR